MKQDHGLFSSVPPGDTEGHRVQNKTAREEDDYLQKVKKTTAR
jgi:hypothetical protein